MKKSLLLIPVVVGVSVAPIAALSGCVLHFSPDEPEYENVEIIHEGSYSTGPMTFEKDKYYKIYVNSYDWESYQTEFAFRQSKATYWKNDVDVIKVVVAGNETQNWREDTSFGYWLLLFNPIKSEDFAIYLRMTETIENYSGILERSANGFAN